MAGSHPEGTQQLSVRGWLKSLGVRPAFQLALLTLATLAIYAQSLSTGFLTDDFILLADLANRGIPWLSGWLADSGYFRPLVSASLAFDLKVFGTDPLGYHVVNLALHLVVTFGVWLSVRMILRRCGHADDRSTAVLSLLAAGGFALHPAHVVDVVWISGRTDLLAGLFVLLSVVTYLRERGPHGGNVRWMTLIASALAMSAKEIGVVVLPLLILLEVSLRVVEGPPFRIFRRLRRQWPLWLLVAGYFVLRASVLTQNPRSLGWTSIELVDIIVLGAKAFALAILPLDLLTLGTWFLSLRLWLQVAAGVVIALSIIGAAVGLRPRSSVEAILLAIPALGLLAMSIPHVISGVVTQRIMYVPLLGTVLLLSPWMQRLASAGSRDRGFPWTAVVAVAILLSWMFGARDLASEWPKVGEAERRGVRSLVDQISDADQFIVIVTYPHRLRQTSMLWSFDHRLAVPLLGKFGKVPNVWTGFGIIGRSVDSIGRHVRLDPPALNGLTFDIATGGEDYLMLDHSQVAPAEGIVVVERPGHRSANRLLEAEATRLNTLTRTVEYRARVIDTTAWRKGALFVWDAGVFRRIR